MAGSRPSPDPPVEAKACPPHDNPSERRPPILVTEAYLPIEGPLRQSFRAAVRDPRTYTDLRWMGAYYGYGVLGLLALLLWPVGLLVDGAWCGLARRAAVVLPMISRLADLDAAWSATLLRAPPRALLARRVAGPGGQQRASTAARTVRGCG
jgi:hypothetical protein